MMKVLSSAMASGAQTPTTAPFISGMYYSKQNGAEYLISEFSFVVIRHGESHTCTKFNFNPITRRVIASEGFWKYEFVFSPDFTFIETGGCQNLSTGRTFVYGTGTGQLFYLRSEEHTFQKAAKKADQEPAMYHLNDDHVAFVFCEYSFVVLMAGKLHYSSSFVYHKPTRRVTAQAHLWIFDFFFSKDFSFVERGVYHSITSTESFVFGTGAGELLFQKMNEEYSIKER